MRNVPPDVVRKFRILEALTMAARDRVQSRDFQDSFTFMQVFWQFSAGIGPVPTKEEVSSILAAPLSDTIKGFGVQIESARVDR